MWLAPCFLAGFLRRNVSNFSRFRPSARTCAAIDEKCLDRGGIDPVTTQLTLPEEQDRDAVAPPHLENSGGVDVDLFDRPSKPCRERCQLVAHVIAQMAIGPNEQR